MSDDIRELYQQVIIDHNKSPKNFYKMDHATHQADGDNPLCGDQIKIFLAIENDKIKDISFLGKGCAISKASASLMTSAIKGKTITEAITLFQNFQSNLTSDTDPKTQNGLGKLDVLAGVREFPVRIKCATLAWHTMMAAIKESKEITTTEK